MGGGQDMTPSSCFTFRSESSGRAAPRGTLLYEGRDSGFRIDAAVLEAQFLIPPGLHLLFFTDNSPYEEELQIVLLDQHLQFLDGLRLGQGYTPGVLSGLSPEGDQQLAFDFFPDTRMRLRVHAEG